MTSKMLDITNNFNGFIKILHFDYTIFSYELY